MSSDALLAHEAKRKRLVKAVQTCRRKVPGLVEDEAWRDWLERRFGTRSLSALQAPQLGKVIDALHAAGAPKAKGGGAGRSRFVETPQVKMIRALWIELVELGVIEDGSEAALAAWVERQSSQRMGAIGPHSANRLIEGLKKWVARARAPAEGGAA